MFFRTFLCIIFSFELKIVFSDRNVLNLSDSIDMSSDRNKSNNYTKINGIAFNNIRVDSKRESLNEIPDIIYDSINLLVENSNYVNETNGKLNSFAIFQ